MKRKIAAVEMFHKSFGLGVGDKPKAHLGMEKIKLRFNLMDEENKEYFEAAMKDDMVEVADALGDMLYILCGTILEHGMQHKIEEVEDESRQNSCGSTRVCRTVVSVDEPGVEPPSQRPPRCD